MTQEKIPVAIPTHLKSDNPDDRKLYHALRKASYENRHLNMSKILKIGATKELKRMGYLK